jgi:hypothetical protein
LPLFEELLHALELKYPGYKAEEQDEWLEKCLSYSELKDILFNVGFSNQCRSFTDVHDCIMFCPESKMRNFLIDLAVPMKYFCQESDLSKTLGCMIDEENHSNYSPCIKQQCDEPNDGTGLEKWCKNIKCHLDCIAPFSVAKCGKQANDELRILMAKQMSSLENARFFTVPVEEFPSTCM